MATEIGAGEPAEERAGIPFHRFAARTARLSLPVIVVLLLLLLTGGIGPLFAVTGLVAGLAVCGLLAHARERRLVEVEGQLRRLMAVSEATDGGFKLLGGDALPAMTKQVETSLQRMRARQDELDRTVSALVDALSDPLLMILGNRRIERANLAATNLFERDCSGQPIESVIRDPGLLAAIDDVLDGNDVAEIKLELPGPPARAFGVRVAPCRWYEQPVALLSLRELTEQVAIERMRSDFVANASHELRTPLTVIRGFVETLAGPAKDDPDARERFLKTMGAEAERMSRLVDDLLSLSKIEQNEHVTPADRVQITDTIGAVVDALRPYARERLVTLSIDASADLPPVLGDRDQLSQLFTNLIDNGVKYGGQDSEVTIGVRYFEKAPAGAGPLTGRRTVEVVIKDRGEGIPAEFLPRLTERFFRVDPARSRRLGGTGLGLAIVKHILRRHRGHISFASKVGLGTEVTVHLVAAS
jgi:two-component system phosphate regulon sensor histidine kinase PhoR